MSESVGMAAGTVAKAVESASKRIQAATIFAAIRKEHRSPEAAISKAWDLVQQIEDEEKGRKRGKR